MKNMIISCLTLLLLFIPSVYGEFRASSAPYISGDTFRFNADHIYDELTKSMKPYRVKAGDTVFVKTDFLNEFFRKIHPAIQEKYILITHNSDYHVPGKFASYLDDSKLIAWFGQNVEDCDHPKMHRIPIGLANRCWTHGNIDAIAKISELLPKLQKTILLYLNITEGTYPERTGVAKLFREQPYCLASPPKEYEAYLTDLAQSKFVLSPRGNGLDCHRTWECLLMGAIPIVKTTSLDPMYEDMPVLIINDWNEINAEFLEQKYEEFKLKSFNPQKAYCDYWLQLIDSYRIQE